MLRTIAVIIAGFALSALVAAGATLYMLRHTEFGRFMTGDSTGMNDRWQIFMSGGRVLFFYVFLPTVIPVAIFVGLLAKRHALPGAAIAVLPISLLASGPSAHRAWISIVLILTAVLLAGLSQHLLRRNDDRESQEGA